MQIIKKAYLLFLVIIFLFPGCTLFEDTTYKVDASKCVSCGNCMNVCPRNAISFKKNSTDKDSIAFIDTNKCIGCGKCKKACPAKAISEN